MLIERASRPGEIIQAIQRPTVSLCETWQAGIDASKWTVTDPATGTAWTVAASGAYLQISAVPNANETARLVSDQLWICAPDTYGTNTVVRRTILEFELKMANIVNVDNTASFIGFMSAADGTRTTQNILGWGLGSDILVAVSDAAGTETTATTFGETITNWNKLRMEIYSGHADFYLNEVLKASLTTNLPDVPMYICAYIDTEAGGAATCAIGMLRCWIEDVVR